jgi:hypothetical protein
VLFDAHGTCHRPLASKARVSARGKSRRLQRVLTDFGCEHSFRTGVDRLREHYGFELSASTIHDVTLLHARRAEAGLEARYAEGFRQIPRKGAPCIIAEVDGTMVCTVMPGERAKPRPREWREMKVAVTQPFQSEQSVYCAVLGSPEQIGQRWGHCARDAGWAFETRFHIVGDGAEWIVSQARETFGTQGRFLLDFFHASEYLAAAGKAIQQRYDLDADAWCHAQHAHLKNNDAASVLEQLLKYAEPLDVADSDAPVRVALRYLSNRIEQLDYKNAIENKLPIGSGLIESTHRHLIHARLKRPGAAWLPQNANSMAQVRVIRANSAWDELWEQKAA